MGAVRAVPEVSHLRQPLKKVLPFFKSILLDILQVLRTFPMLHIVNTSTTQARVILSRNNSRATSLDLFTLIQLFR